MNIYYLDSLKRVNSIDISCCLTITVMCHCNGKFHIMDILNKIMTGDSYFFFFSKLTFDCIVSFVLIACFSFQHFSHKLLIKLLLSQSMKCN